MKSVIDFAGMDQEYAAWQAVVMECRRLGIDMNEPKYNRLIKAVCVWGERLHALRANQREDQVDRALISYLDQYELAKKQQL
jgi:hypothetical protein